MFSRLGSSLTPSSNFGSYGRTYGSMSVGSSRSKNGSAKRIQHHAKSHGYKVNYLNTELLWTECQFNTCPSSFMTCYSQANGNYDSFKSCVCQANPYIGGCTSTN